MKVNSIQAHYKILIKFFNFVELIWAKTVYLSDKANLPILNTFSLQVIFYELFYSDYPKHP
jgi:hypothetical protein